MPNQKMRGFTLLELLVVITIIGVLAAVVIVSLDRARISSRDTARFQQASEVLKAVELYYTDNGVYPDDGDAGVSNPVLLTTIAGTITYLSTIPADPVYPPANSYQYCTSADLRSMAILVNTEDDQGGSDYCAVSRGTDQYSDLVCTGLSGYDRCSDRIN